MGWIFRVLVVVALAGSARADSAYLYGLHFWGLPSGQPVDPVPASLLDCPAYGGWDLEVILTHGEVWAGAAYYVPFYSDLYSNKHVSLITRIDYVWGQTVPSPTNPDYANWPNTVAGQVDLLRPYAHTWIIGNEPNLIGEGGAWPNNQITPAGYATIYRNVRNAIQALPASPAGPHRVLIAPVSPGGVVAGIRWMSGADWLGQVIDNLPKAEIDGFAIHSYGGTLAEFHNGYVEQLNVIDAKGLADRPVYMTEWNRYATPGNAAQEAAAAQFCRDAFADVHAWNNAGYHNIVSMCWFVYDGTSNGNGSWDGYSIEYWKTNGNPYGNAGDLYTAFEQTVDLRYAAGAVGTPSQPRPTAAFTSGATDGEAPLAVAFTDQTTGNVTARLWDFGDGATSTATNPAHTYLEPGAYTVSLTATGPGGSDTASKSAYVAVVNAAACTDQWLTTFESYASDTQAMFRDPRTSGTTSGHLKTSPNVSLVSSEVSGADGRKTCKVQWQFVDASTSRWLRLTTSNTANLPNPSIDVRRAVRVRLRLDSGSLRVCLGVRETGVNVPFGGNGGTSGTIEWVGAESVISGAPQGVLVNGQPGVWQALTLVPRADNIRALTGDGVLAAANHKGTLEHLAFASTGAAGPFTVYIDSVEQPCSPAADFDGDFDVDQEDFGHFQRCLNGPYFAQMEPACQVARFDGDADVDVDDLTLFLNCRTVPGMFADPECMP